MEGQNGERKVRGVNVGADGGSEGRMEGQSGGGAGWLVVARASGAVRGEGGEQEMM